MFTEKEFIGCTRTGNEILICFNTVTPLTFKSDISKLIVKENVVLTNDDKCYLIKGDGWSFYVSDLCLLLMQEQVLIPTVCYA
ncbi:hypothetical protein L0B53_12165 [Vibrio sp. SS-MA-C1-2]|uniref:hypothetical protein n=1 Tax=Vibrio sp. SS-MA-C1-2 TaxID=2908646 RepID=UPI001F34EF6A|nr:hypothetical protein [Vibrio sp. SS-MA-C1-2]UJF17781.1 hypothetical protein L0B53_12165 [Vibrio sp. SS-MA-C1-2]